MFTDKNVLFLQRCFDVARLASGTSPNPAVGSIIVAPDGRIIGEGFTQPFGGPHAEVMAVASVKNVDRPLLPLSTIFVTLEPCAHFGKTAPCVDLILKEKISTVVIAHLDPNPLVCQKSVTKLRENNVQVQIFINNNVLMSENSVYTDGTSFFNQKQLENGKDATLLPFFQNITEKRPFIILKWAESADGFIGNSEKQVSITNNFSKRLVHKWRSEVDAIMVGTRTVEVDNPKLDNRFYYGKSPIRIILDRNARLSRAFNVFDGSVRTIVFSENTEGGAGEHSSENVAETSYSPLTVKNSNYTTFPVERRLLQFDDFLLENILNQLWADKIGILFVEGGAALLSSFIKLGLWDEARVFTSSKTLGSGISAPQLLEGVLHDTAQLDDDTLRLYRRE
jgi:diaminohydroxyphosphoribosylaminopyrimidine deaminase / 5-amino-6-(5-phosphoribosylamino)uracil reductase